MAEVVFDNVPEDVLSAVIEFWHFKEGDHVEQGEDLVELKTGDNRTFAISAPVSGILTDRFHSEEDEVEIGEVLAEIQEEGETFDDDLDLDDYDEDEVIEEEEEDVEEDVEDIDEEDEY